MPEHSYSRCWLHVIWATHGWHKTLSENAAKEVSNFLRRYVQGKSIFLKTIYVNDDHVHMLVDLPTNLSIQELVKLLKGSSSHWINENRLVAGRFRWQRGYGVFSVSQSQLPTIERYIADQREHHRRKTFADEYELFIKKNGLELNDDGRVA